MTTQRDATPETDLFFGTLVHMNPAAVPSDEGPLHNFCGNLERDRDRLRAQLAGVVEKAAKCREVVPILPGDIPDEMYAALQGDKDLCAEALRIIVRQTLDEYEAAIRALSTEAPKTEGSHEITR